jgi:cytochrome P450
MRHPPGPRGPEALGFFGRGSVGNTLSFLEATARQYGPLSSFRVLHKRIYLIDDADLVQQVLVTRQHEFIRDTGATLLRELVGDGLLTREEPLHRERRRILQPAFHRQQIDSYAERIAGECERTSLEWENKDTIDIRMEMRRLTLSIVGTTLFGTEFRDSAGQIADVLQRVGRKSTWLGPGITFLEPVVLAYRGLFPRALSLFFPRERRELEQIVDPIIRSRRGAQQRDFLSLILNSDSDTDDPLTDVDVQNEVVTFVLAGHETTSTALTWTWYLLAEHQDIAAHMQNELDTVLAGRTPSLEDVGRLTYTSNVFREALRLYPPALLFGRRPKADVELGGYRIRRGSSIFLSPYITQRNPGYFADPETFNPDRWDHMEAPKFAYFPFGAGAKMCIGEPLARLEGLLALATLGQKWSLLRTNTSPVGFAPGPVLNPDQRIIMQLERRTQPDLARSAFNFG